MEVFIELSTIIALALGVALIMRLLKQPLIVGYILTGIIVGPYVLNILHNSDIIELFSKIGITILLFIVGLSLSPHVIREVGKVSLITGIGQVVFTSAVGFGIALLLGIDRIAALYVAIALTFSSTIIILKLLSDKGDLNTLYGKIAIGFLLVQDIIATSILLIASSFASSGGENVLYIAGITLLKGALLIWLMLAISHYILPRLSRYIAESQELLFLFSIAWGLGIASLFRISGFSVEIGALIAGVSLSMTPYAFEVASRMRPLRDFFILLFFILLGSQMVLADVGSLLIPALTLSIFVLIGNPIIMVVLMNILGYSKRTAFQAGLTVAQISEFSLILATLGFQIGHLSQDILSLITLVGLITIAGSTYLILYSEHIYPKVENILKFLEIRRSRKKTAHTDIYNAILFGYQRVGKDFITSLERLGLDYIVVDFNPESIQQLEESEIPCKYGDAKDSAFLAELDLKGLKYLVTTIPDFETNLFLLRAVRAQNKRVITVMLSHNREDTLALYAEGASYVIMPHYLGAQYAVRLIARAGLNKQEYHAHRNRHLAHLEKNK